MLEKIMKIGLNVFDGDVLEDKSPFKLTIGDGAADYAVCHVDPQRFTLGESIEKAKKLAEKFKKTGIDFIANFEFQNFDMKSESVDGYKWAERPDGTHLLNIPGEYLKALSSGGNLIGIMYDEFEHVIANRNLSLEIAAKLLKRFPAFPLFNGRDALKQGELLSSQIREFAAGLKEKGAKNIYGEHVFPILFHKFASSGITPNFKSQKESYSNVQHAIAAGAALQYGTELSNCVDCWYRLTNPGHSAEEMYNNLKFAYYAGVNRVYVESSAVMVKDNKLTAHGEKFRQFCKEYKGKERDWDVHDYTPEIGIVRYDDTFWGQCDPVMWKRMLFGNSKVKPDYRCREYLKAFHLITHGETCINGLSWGRISPWSIKPHRSFASMNSTAVFDEKADEKCLASLKLCFLCGISISEETIKNVEKAVEENGLTVVTTQRFIPASVACKVKGRYCEIAEGKGKWIVVRSFRDPRLKTAVKPYIGNKNEIRLTFGEKEIKFKISDDGNAITL